MAHTSTTTLKAPDLGVFLLILLTCVPCRGSSSSSAPSADKVSVGNGVTMRVDHRDSLSSPLLPNTQEERLRGLLAREAIRSTSRAQSSPPSFENAGLWHGSRDLSPANASLQFGSTMGEYIIAVSVGTPAQDANLLLDIAMGVTWLQCETCEDCFSQPASSFNLKTSSSYSPILCGDTICWIFAKHLNGSCDYGAGDSPAPCSYGRTYTNGMYTQGDFGYDTFSFNTSPLMDFKQVPFGCSSITTIANGIEYQAFDGIFSIAAGPASFASIFLPRFAYCLPVPFTNGNGGYLTLGGTGPVGLTSESVSFEFYVNGNISSHYYVPLVGISVNNKVSSDMAASLARTHNGTGVVLDFSTMVSYMVSSAYTSLRDAFRVAMGKAGFHLLSPTPKRAPANLESCYNLPMGLNQATRLPSVKLLVEGGFSIPLAPHNYLMSVGHDAYCFAFAPVTPLSPSANVSVLGAAIQQGFNIAFELGTKQISISPGGC